MYMILAKEAGNSDYEVVDYCHENELSDTIASWKEQFEFVISERC